jgi:hypothetical protein
MGRIGLDRLESAEIAGVKDAEIGDEQGPEERPEPGAPPGQRHSSVTRHLGFLEDTVAGLRVRLLAAKDLVFRYGTAKQTESVRHKRFRRAGIAFRGIPTEGPMTDKRRRTDLSGEEARPSLDVARRRRSPK